MPLVYGLSDLLISIKFLQFFKTELLSFLTVATKNATVHFIHAKKLTKIQSKVRHSFATFLHLRNILLICILAMCICVSSRFYSKRIEPNSYLWINLVAIFFGDHSSLCPFFSQVHRFFCSHFLILFRYMLFLSV